MVSYSLPINNAAGNGAQALHAAAENGHVFAIQALVEGGADINSLGALGITPLAIAAQHNQAKAVKALLDLGADPEARSVNDGATALYFAAGHGFEEVVKVLLQARARVNARQRRSGGFPLLYAAGVGHAHIVRLLLSAKANPNLAASNGLRSIHAAVAIDSEQEIDMLVQAGADITAAGSEGKYVWHFAVSSRSLRALHCLAKHVRRLVKEKQWDLQRQRDFVNVREPSDGATALHVACSNGDVASMRVLLDLGADATLRLQGESSYGATALYLAAQSGNADAVTLLLRRGVDPDEALLPPSNVTPLLAAVEKGGRFDKGGVL